MNFEKIDIYGFKSFADKVEIKFEDGITAIVGPNGCGKSNVADSIRFVMGESSAKSMRGESMQDVIFNGTEKRKSQSYCEVSLSFNNSNRVFDIDLDSVTLTRKLYKSGESEYLINKTPCRRKDVVDAFRKLGLGKESYSVIGQGKIDSILSAKPEDRRSVFEETAGIAKFKEDRRASENKLSNVNENLTRINDIIIELEKQLGPLKSQAESAKIFLELSNRLKQLEVDIYVFQYNNSNSEKEKIREVIFGIDEEIKLKQSELEKAVLVYDDAQSEIESLDDRLNSLRDELLNLTVELEKQNGEIKLYNEKISIVEEQNDKLLGQVESCKFLAKELEEKSAQLARQKEEVKKQIEEDERSQKVLETNYNLVLEKISIGEQSAEEFESKFYEAFEKSGDVSTIGAKLQAELDSLKQRQTELSKEKDNLEEESKSLNYKVETAEGDIEKIENKIEKLNSQKEDISLELENLNDKFNENIEEIDEKKVSYHTSLSKLNVLNEMKEYNEGYQVSVKRLLEQAKSGSTIGGKIIGAVAELVSVPATYEVAIEMALGASIQNIVTKNASDANDLIKYLKDNKFGRVTFLPISDVKQRAIPASVLEKMNMRGVMGIASDVVSFDKVYEPIFKSLLGATVIVDNMENAVEFSRATGFLVRAVTLEGDIVSTQGSMTGGSRKDVGVGLLARDREIENLTASIESIKKELVDLERSQASLKNQINAKNEEYNSKNDEIHVLEMEKAKQDESISNYEDQKDEIEKTLLEHEISFDALLDKIDFVERELEKISLEKENAESKKTEASKSKKQASDDFGKLRKERDEIFESLGEIKIKIEGEKNNLSNIESETERNFVSIAQNDFKQKETVLEVQKNNATIDGLKQNIDDLMASSAFSASAKKVELVREKIAGVTEDKKEYQQKMNEADGQKMLLSGEIQRANDKKAKEENQIVKIDSELENLQNRVWEQYEMTYADAKVVANSEIDLKAEQAECTEIKKKIQRLGNVNLSAIEDIKLVSERYEDMSKQRDDLVKAQRDLQTIIRDLTNQMEDKFKTRFEQIRNNFQVIFKELFGGGRADIKLEDENNSLECGIDIIAEPPGKKLQNITLLSGGEKALTAVAILFSILKLRPMPFCVLDEIEAALDDANVEKYAKYLHRYSGDTQFIVITHRKPTMELADCLYGVTMEEKGVSKVVSVKLSDAIKIDNGEI